MNKTSLKKIARQKVNELTANMSNDEMRALLVENTHYSRSLIDTALGNATAEQLREEITCLLSLWDIRRLMGEIAA